MKRFDFTLADTMYTVMSDKKINFGFTLAEVLITLGIIGVVAAMTMPVLIQNYQKTAWTNQLKKDYTMAAQAFRKMMSDDQVDNLVDTTVFQSVIGDKCYGYDGVNSANCKEIYKNLKNYFNIVAIEPTGTYKYSYIKKGSTPIYPDNKKTGARIVFADGSFIMRYQFSKEPEKSTFDCDIIRQQGGNLCAYVGRVVFDVNGLKGPNVEGRDIFDFYIGNNGYLYPFWSKDEVIYVYGNDEQAWYNNPEACGTKGAADAHIKAKYGSGCAARIIENSWDMDY